MTAPPAEANLDDLRRRARRRLVGAIVLALAAAVFVPMLLESEPKPLGEDVSVRIPPIDDGKFVNKLGEKGRADPKGAAKGDAKQDGPRADGARKDAAKSDAPKAEPEAPAAADAPKPDAVAPPASTAEMPPAAPKRSLEEAEQRVLTAPAKAPAASTAPAPAPVPAAKAPSPEAAPAAAPAAPAPAAPAPAATTPPAKADASGAAFSVQLAAFSDDKGANALANRLKKAGYAAYTEPLETSRGTLWRVRVGPFPSREAAAAVRDKLKGEGHSGIVAPVK